MTDLVTGTIESIAYRGAGILRPADGPVALVYGGVCAGERVTARVVRRHPRHVEAELAEVETPSPDRIDPVCRLPGGERVPGCVYDHLAYPAEVAAKDAQLTDFLRRPLRKALGGGFDLASIRRPPLPSPNPLHYRNKIVLHARIGREARALGYLGDDNRTVVDIPACPLAHPDINAELASIREDADFRRAVCDGDALTLRRTPHDGVVAWLGRPPARSRPLTETAFFGDLEVPLDGFYQVNPEVADLLARDLADAALARPPRAVIDAYCGIGILGLAIQARAREAGETPPRLLGMETGRAAVAAARRNATRLGFSAEYACCPVSDGLAAALDETGADGTLVVLDPPREGLEPGVVRLLAERRPERIAFVSCSPDRLARDLERLCAPDGGGYAPESARLYDMFPRTHHFESLVLLSRSPAP